MAAELPGHQQRVHDLETQIAGLRGQVKDLENDTRLREIAEEIAGIDRLLVEQERLMGELSGERDIDTKDLTGQIDSLQSKFTTVLDTDERIREMKAEIFGIEKTIAETEGKIAQLADDRDSELISLRSRLKSDTEKLSVLDLKDPACQSSTCSFIVDALKSKDGLPDLNKAISDRAGLQIGRAHV